MQYRSDRYGNDISVLGFGCMRFRRSGAGIDYAPAEAQILAAVERGVNYFDTAYIYPGSEALLGEVMEKNGLRNKLRIATKLPQFMVKTLSQAKSIFEEELARLRTDHVDYYLMHRITDPVQHGKLMELGVFDWLAEEQAAGRIGQVGFSYHGGTEGFLRLLELRDWDFCQIQYNYLDENTQAGRRGLEAAAAKGIPVVIMEPLRGGRLVDGLPASAKSVIAESGHGWTSAELAFRWLWDQPGVSCVLSGMNSLEMVDENCRVAELALPGHFTDEDRSLVERVVAEIHAAVEIGCTGCSYCMPCPKGVDIPATFHCYYEMSRTSKFAGRYEYFQSVGLRKQPAFASQCVECGACMKLCPQGLEIPWLLKKADRALRPRHVKIALAVARAFTFI